MSEEQVQPTPEPEIECSVCGFAGQPPLACEICRGTAKVQSRAYTRTEENQGKGKDETRYGRTGNVSPKIVNLPGSANPTQG
jgi:hypothetical protein